MVNRKFRFTAIINRAPIRRQLYLMYAAVIVVPVVLIGMFLLLYTYRMMVNYHTDLLESDNHRVRNILFEITTQIYNISENISFNQEIQEILTKEYTDQQEYKAAALQNNILDSYEEIYMEISAIEIYTDNPALVSYKQFRRADEEIADTDWYQKAIVQSGIFWQEMSREDKNRNQYWNLCLVRKIPLINSPYHAVLVIRISDDYLRTRVDSNEYINMLSVGESTA
ncbi:MAG: sensor histidine kinase, partial [Lachnospiraceae bacterium]|nr:sensor histidine kinase [Lachnospiraceae bacterium]